MTRFVGRIVLAAVALVAVLAILGSLGTILPGLNLPFSTSNVDRSQPPLLRELEDIGEYRAATGNFQVIVDLEKDTRFVPSFIKGERTVMVVVGSVDAGVRLDRLTRDAVVTEGGTVSVTLPPVTMFEPRVDPERSAVAGRSRGVIDRVGDVFGDGGGDERALLALGGRKLETAAAASSDLQARAQANTRAMVEDLFAQAGFSSVTVTFAADAV